MKKNIDRFIIILAAAAFISMLPAAAYYHGQYLKNSASGPLEKIKSDICDFIKNEITSCALQENYQCNIFQYPVIRLNLSDMSVIPPQYKARLLSELELRHNSFDSTVLERLKSVIKTGPAETAAATLSYYLNDREDSYGLEKAVLYAYLIKIKNDLNQPFDDELNAFKKLSVSIKNNEEIKFLYEKLKGSIVSLKTLSDDSLSGILSDNAGAGQKSEVPDLINEKMPALFLSIKSEALSKSSVKNISIKPLAAGSDKNYILVSTSVEKNAGRSEKTGAPAATEKIAAAAVINVNNLNYILKSKYNAYLSSKEDVGIISADFCTPYKIIAADINLNRSYLMESAFYLPLITTLAVFYILKKRENEAFRLSLNMTDFVSKISHQLKTPLSSSLLYLELAEKHLESAEDEKAREAISLAHEQAKALSFLFENFSVLNRIFSENMLLNIVESDIEEELILHIKSYKAQIESGILKVSFNLMEDNRAMVDKWAFYNIIANLISNSLKYSKKLSTEIKFKAEIKNGLMALYISDNGPGVSEIDAPKIFDKFYKGSAAESEFRSSGLGLYIARALAQKMNGELTLDNNFKNGARFILYMRMPY